MIVTLQAGDGSGRVATVNASGRLESQVGNTVTTEVANTVTTKRAPVMAFRTSANVGNSSGVLVSARTGRQGFYAQNQDAVNAVYLRFEAMTATNQDWKVPPGGEFRAESFPYEGEIRAISDGANSTVLVLEMAP